MRPLIIRNAKGHEDPLDLDTQEAIQRLEQEMNNGMLAVAVKGETAVQVLDPQDPAVKEADEVRMFSPLQGG
mgnify:CR=1 FL=1